MATASAPLRPLQVFVSYAHKDRQYAADLALHLRDLKDGGLIRLWTDWEIEPGKAWRPEILQQLQAADIVLLLVSADSINSDFVVHEEMRRAMERSDEGTARLIPIRVRPVFLSDHQPLARLQFLPSGPLAVSQWEDQDSAYVNIAQGVSRVAHQLWMKQMVTDAPSAPPPAIVPPPQPSPAPARVPDGGAGAVRAELGIPGRPHFWDVELRLEGGLLRGGFTVLALGAGAPGGEPVPMELNLPDLLLRAARVKSGAADPADAADLGARLYQALFPREVRQVWERGQKIMRADTLLRLRLDVQAPELALLPWELLRVPDEPLLDTGPPAGEPYAAAGAERGGYFLGMSPRRPILRWTRASGAPPARAPRLGGPLRLLLAVEGDRDAARRQAHRFRDLLADAVRARRIVVKAVSVTALPDLLRRRRRHHHVVHYFGGGGPISAGARGETGGPAEGGGRAALRLRVLPHQQPPDHHQRHRGRGEPALAARQPRGGHGGR
ncbi:MAG TPA: toll/interleukin-1 receptor domain-containing protein, partial [Longimicrobium sp.]|nr:toll/interleukin-1 receptor domain-containing protein [Longimicrobium sp.]